MGRVTILIALFSLFCSTLLAERIFIDKGRKIKFFDNNTYSYIFDGEIVSKNDGRRIILRDNHTWDYISDYSNEMITDDTGKRVWLKRDGTWGYIKNFPDRDYSFRNTNLEEFGRNKTKITGRVANQTNEDYSYVNFNIYIFDNISYSYRLEGKITINRFMAGDERGFEEYLDVRRGDILSYYVEFAGGERIERFIDTGREHPKRLKRHSNEKTLGEAQDELNR